MKNAEIQLGALRNERDAMYMSLWDKVKRMYAGVKSAPLMRVRGLSRAGRKTHEREFKTGPSARQLRPEKVHEFEPMQRAQAGAPSRAAH